MFGSLKKKLKDVMEKAKVITKEESLKNEPKIAGEGQPTLEEMIETADSLDKQVDKKIEDLEELKERVKEETEEEPKSVADSDPRASAILEEQIDRHIEELSEIKEKTAEEKPPSAKVAAKEEKSRFSLLKKVTEKKLSEGEIEKILKELHIALLENDVAVEVAEKISQDVKGQLLGASVKRGKVEDTIRDALKYAMLDVMKQEKIDIERLIKEKDGPFTIMFIGFNGVGKTTNLCKLAYKLKDYKPVLAAADTFRAASIEQLEEHGTRLGLRVIKHAYGSDAAAVIFDAKKHATAAGSKLVLADTAGRSHSNVNLMDELKKVSRVNQPDMKILVLDSVTGNDIYDQCRLFNESVGVDAIILTKADVYERGGAALSAAYTLKKPILYIGVGQEYNDLKEFEPEEIVRNLLG